MQRLLQNICHPSTPTPTVQSALRSANTCAMLTHMNDDLIGSTEATQILKVDKATISRWVASGHLHPAHKLPTKNGAYLFHRADIENLATERAAS